MFSPICFSSIAQFLLLVAMLLPYCCTLNDSLENRAFIFLSYVSLASQFIGQAYIYKCRNEPAQENKYTGYKYHGNHDKKKD